MTTLSSEQFWKSMELATAALAVYRAENEALRIRVAEAEAGAMALLDAVNGDRHA